jgi:hypothetical protein
MHHASRAVKHEGQGIKHRACGYTYNLCCRLLQFGGPERPPVPLRRHERLALEPCLGHVDEPKEDAAEHAEAEQERERHVRVVRGIDDRAADERADERRCLPDDREECKKEEPSPGQTVCTLKQNRMTYICSMGDTSEIIVWLYAYHGQTSNP